MIECNAQHEDEQEEHEQGPAYPFHSYAVQEPRVVSRCTAQAS